MSAFSGKAARTSDEGGGGMLDRFGKQYGPYAFGVISLLVIWFAVVQPELRATRTDAQTNLKVAETLREVVLRLEKIVERLDRAR